MIFGTFEIVNTQKETERERESARVGQLKRVC